MDILRLNELWERIYRTEESPDQHNVYIMEFCRYLILEVEKHEEMDASQLEKDEKIEMYLIQLNKITESIGKLYDRLFLQLDHSDDFAPFRFKTEALMKRNQEINALIIKIQRENESLGNEKICIDKLSIDLDTVQKGIESIQMYKKQMSTEFFDAYAKLSLDLKPFVPAQESKLREIIPSFSMIIKWNSFFHWKKKYLFKRNEILNNNSLEEAVTRTQLFKKLNYNNVRFALLLTNGKRFEFPLQQIFPDLIGESGSLYFSVQNLHLHLYATSPAKGTFDCALFNINNNPETLIQSLIHHGN